MAESGRHIMSDRQKNEMVPGTTTLQIKIGGMSCSFCANSIHKAISRAPGVDEVHVSIAHEEALVRYRPEHVTETEIKDTLRGLGYTVRDPRKVQTFEEQNAIMRHERNNLLVAASFAAAMFVTMVAMWLDLLAIETWQIWTAWAVATYVFFWPEQIGLHQIEEAVTSLGFRVQRTHVAGHDETVA